MNWGLSFTKSHLLACSLTHLLALQGKGGEERGGMCTYLNHRRNSELKRTSHTASEESLGYLVEIPLVFVDIGLCLVASAQSLA
jgi:hypothetical protein